MGAFTGSTFTEMVDDGLSTNVTKMDSSFHAWYSANIISSDARLHRCTNGNAEDASPPPEGLRYWCARPPTLIPRMTFQYARK